MKIVCKINLEIDFSEHGTHPNSFVKKRLGENSNDLPRASARGL